jgi:hypothetical protein
MKDNNSTIQVRVAKASMFEKIILNAASALWVSVLWSGVGAAVGSPGRTCPSGLMAIYSLIVSPVHEGVYIRDTVT